MLSKFASVNGIKLHYLEKGDGLPIFLLHGLTANAHAFDGLMAEGLDKLGRILSVDLRGRGLSDKPDADYAMDTHCKDIEELIKNLGLEKVVLIGHSFGALMSWNLANSIPHVIEKIVFIDAAASLHPDTRELLMPTMQRLGKEFDSFEEYLLQMKDATFLQNQWDDAMLSYFDADVEIMENGKVKQRSKPEHILEAVNGALSQDLIPKIKNTQQPSLLINATGSYGPPDAPPLLPAEKALETFAIMPNCRYVHVPGNHQTMLYGEGAKQIVAEITKFLKS
jgi:pimeloyl-ACP methyl ester carboxylesterase